MKKLLLSAMAMLAVSALFVGCGGDEPEDDLRPEQVERGDNVVEDDIIRQDAGSATQMSPELSTN